MHEDSPVIPPSDYQPAEPLPSMFGSEVRERVVSQELGSLDRLESQIRLAQETGNSQLAAQLEQTAADKRTRLKRFAVVAEGSNFSDEVEQQVTEEAKIPLRKRFGQLVRKAGVKLRHPIISTETGSRVSNWYKDEEKGRRRKIVTAVVGAGALLAAGVVAYKLTQHGGGDAPLRVNNGSGSRHLTPDQQLWWDGLTPDQQTAWQSREAHDFVRWATEFDSANPGLSGNQKLELWNKFFDNLPK